MKIARHATGRQAVVVFDHAYHGRTNLTMALTAKNMPYKHRFGPFAGEIYRVPMSYPLRDGGLSGAEAAARAHRPDREAGRRGERGRRADRADPGRGRLRRAGAGLPAGAAPRGRRRPGRSSSPTRSRPASAVPATGSPATTRASCPTWSPRPRASPAGCRWPAVTGRAEMMDAVHVGGLGGTYGGNPIACAAALAAHRDDARAGPGRRRPADRVGDDRRLHALAARDPRIGEVRGRGAMLAVELVEPGHRLDGPDPAAATAAVAAGLPRRRPARRSPAAPTATCCASCRRW